MQTSRLLYEDFQTKFVGQHWDYSSYSQDAEKSRSYRCDEAIEVLAMA